MRRQPRLVVLAVDLLERHDVAAGGSLRPRSMPRIWSWSERISSVSSRLSRSSGTQKHGGWLAVAGNHHSLMLAGDPIDELRKAGLDRCKGQRLSHVTIILVTSDAARDSQRTCLSEIGTARLGDLPHTTRGVVTKQAPFLHPETGEPCTVAPAHFAHPKPLMVERVEVGTESAGPPPRLPPLLALLLPPGPELRERRASTRARAEARIGDCLRALSLGLSGCAWASFGGRAC